MKPIIRNKTVFALGVSGIAALSLLSGCVVEPSGRVVFRPLVVEPARRVVVVPAQPPPPPPPAPVVVTVAPEPVLVPDDYVWDGYEYVGVVGDQYYYLGPGNVWIVCDPVRFGRFHDYIRIHPDWHVHVRFRTDAHGRYQPRRDDRR
jgi:hypothetical protein